MASIPKDESVVKLHSDWPGSLMLDEVWLRARRVLVHRLEAEGLWPTGPGLQSHRARRVDLGNDLRRTLLAQVLSPVDHRYLESDAAFGSASGQVHSKIGHCLAFGHELGSVLHRVAANSGTYPEQPCSLAEARAAQLCAIFNLGISLFDLVHDESHELAQAFTQIFDKEVLLGALASRESMAKLDTAVADLKVPELRVLGRIVVTFIAGLHDAVPMRHELEPIGAALVSAYAAETASVNHRTDAVSLELSRAKSTIPFHILLETIALVGDSTVASAVPALRPVVDAIGTTFWLVDDLVDLVADFQADALNSILAQASMTMPRTADRDDIEYALLEHVLDGNYVEDTVEQIVTALQAMSHNFMSPGCNASTATVITLILNYVRFWME